MSKGNLFLGMARGSVGDVTFTHVDGEQVARARNRAPRNPKTAIQLLQRVVLKTSSSAYSLMQDICNHSFQGAAEGTMSQAEFNKANIGWMRTLLAIEINSGDPEDILSSVESNFAPRYSEGIEFNPYVVSNGSLGTIPVEWLGSLPTPAFGIPIDLGKANPTYAEVCAAFGISQADQLTFLNLSLDDTKEGGTCNGFDYCRVIMEPDSSVMTTAFLDGTAINNPNEKNKGDFKFTIQQSSGSYYLTFISSRFNAAKNTVNAVCAATVILSRWNGTVWARSPQTLVCRPYTLTEAGHLEWDHGTDYLSDAVYSYMTDESSTLYLNQAGSPGSGTVPAVTGVIESCTIGGQSKARGSVTNISSAVVVTATMAQAQQGVTYKLAVFEDGPEGLAPTPVKEATFSGASASIPSYSYSEGGWKVCLVANNVVIDEYCTIIGPDVP